VGVPATKFDNHVRPGWFRLVAVLLLIGATAAAQGEVRLSLTGSNVGDEYGSTINTVGDVNHDGIPDIIVGAPFDLPLLGHPGSAKVYSGLDGTLLWSFQGSAPNQVFGFGVAPAGDIDHDGTPDFLIGISSNGSTGGAGGGARIYSGATGLVLRSFAGTIASDAFGQTLDTLGDVNGDGTDDVIIGTSFAPNASQPGYAKVFSGATGAVLYTKTGTFNGERFGAVYAAGDVNGDGVLDFIVGAIGDHVNGTNSGSIFVYSGATGALLFSAHGTAANQLFGYSAAGVGDLNGDGFGEVVAGTYIPSGSGYANVYAGPGGALLYHLTSGVTGDAFGHSVAGVGDVDGDGVKDFVVAAPNSNAGGTLSGRILAYSGADGSVLRDFVGSGPSLHFGYAVKGAGDVNGDRIPDIAVGFLVPGSTGMPGRAQVVSVCAAQAFGLGLAATETLSLAWTLGAAGQEAAGGPAVMGATPFDPGIIAASSASVQATYYGVPVLLDISPGLLTTLPITYDASGRLDLPISLRNPSLAGLTVYVQAFEANAAAPQGWYASNGLMLLFGL
jgi:hypothetical protein